MTAESRMERNVSAVIDGRYRERRRLTPSITVRRADAMQTRLLVLVLTLLPLAARACDLCGCYTPQLNSMPKEEMSPSGIYAAVAEQFTHFGTLQFDADEIANPTGQRLESSITQSCTLEHEDRCAYMLIWIGLT